MFLSTAEGFLSACFFFRFFFFFFFFSKYVFTKTLSATLSVDTNLGQKCLQSLSAAHKG